jgi:hypothetical protein
VLAAGRCLGMPSKSPASHHRPPEN